MRPLTPRAPALLTPRTLAPVALLTAVIATGCSPVEFDLPGTEAVQAADSHRIDYPPSELSVEGPDLCVDGERGGSDCTEPQALRWSIPLGEEHDDERYLLPVDSGMTVHSTRHHLYTSPRHRVYAGPDVLYHLEGDSVRAVDPGTGEQKWFADLRGDERRIAGGLHAAGDQVAVELHTHLPYHGEAETLVFLDASDGSETARLPAEGRFVGMAPDGVVVTEPVRGTLRGVDVSTGDELWDFVSDVPDPDEDRSHQWSTGFDGETVSLVVVRRFTDGDDEWEPYRILRVDARSGDELPAPDPDEIGEAELEELRETVDSIQQLAFDTSPAAESGEGIHHYFWQDADGDYEHDHPDTFDDGLLRGVGMVQWHPWSEDGVAVGIACAPDAVRPQDPPADAVPWTAVCDNPRLFAVNP